MNQEIQQAVLALGGLLLESPAYLNMQEAEETALNDDALQAEYREYALLRGQLQELNLNEGSDEEKLIALQDDIDRVQLNLQNMPNMVALGDARRGFDDLMNEVNTLLADMLEPDDEDEGEAGCGSSGGCAGCSGCGSR